MLTLLSVLLTTSFYAAAEVPSTPRRGQSELRGALSYFTSTSNFAVDGGGSEEVQSGGEYSQRLGEFTYTYDLRADWRILGGFSAASAESSDASFSRSNSGLNEIYGGAQKWYEIEKFDFVARGDFVYPLFKVEEGGDDALLGEGALRASGSALLIYPWGGLKPFAHLGFEYRDGGRSFLLPYGVGLKFRSGRFWLQGEYRGYESVVDDADTENRMDREVYLGQVNGGSFRYYSVNPSASEIAVEAGARFGAFGVFGGVAMTVLGSSSADGLSAMVGLSYRPNFSRSVDTGREPEPFDIRNERYDESLFEEPSAPKPPTAVIQKPQDVEVQLQLKHVPPKKKNNAKIKKQNAKKLDKLMKDTENSLEKK